MGLVRRTPRSIVASPIREESSIARGPLCAYPAAAKYRFTGSTSDAEATSVVNNAEADRDSLTFAEFELPRVRGVPPTI
jgi:hypothetical protein